MIEPLLRNIVRTLVIPSTRRRRGGARRKQQLGLALLMILFTLFMVVVRHWGLGFIS
ncbi:MULTISPECIES: hypothetical protein [unclassified Sphingobium]|uniref:hypothetical protein n=1 Tax=unclassified Sphingobium TaxID=2611147 RepID=UPI0035A5AB07